MENKPKAIQKMVIGQPFTSPGDLPNPRIKPRSPALQQDSLPADPQGKPKNTGVGSLSILQQIFPSQELNQGLLHCRWIPYQLSYQGSPIGSYILIITSNVSAPTKRYRLTVQIKTCACMHFHLPYHFAGSPRLYTVILYCQVNHISIMVCNCNYVLLFVWLLIVETDKNLLLL